MGTIWVEYLHQSTPVMKIAIYWFAEINSAGFFMSPILANVIIHLKVGAQKKIVMGPAACAMAFLATSGSGIFIRAACNLGTIPNDINNISNQFISTGLTHI
jgi:hypothetical protein